MYMQNAEVLSIPFSFSASLDKCLCQAGECLLSVTNGGTSDNTYISICKIQVFSETSSTSFFRRGYYGTNHTYIDIWFLLSCVHLPCKKLFFLTGLSEWLHGPEINSQFHQGIKSLYLPAQSILLTICQRALVKAPFLDRKTPDSARFSWIVAQRFPLRRAQFTRAAVIDQVKCHHFFT